MHTTAQIDALIRSELWSSMLKEEAKDDLQAKAYVNWLTEFPDGTTFTIPSIGDATIRNYVEDTPVQYDSMDTGEFQFTISEYVSSATYITKKARQDAYYAAKLEASFVPKQRRALDEKVETDILALGAAGASGGQVARSGATDGNAINGADHRFIATGTSEAMAVADFAKALYSLKKANMSDTNLIAIVDPSVEYTLNTIANLVNFSNNPRWEGIVETGIGQKNRFVKNIFGFDVYVSNYLPKDQNETDGTLSTTAGVANLFMSLSDKEMYPFMGAWRQMPEVDGDYNKDFQREEYVTTARYGLKVYRPENLVVVLSDVDVV